MGMSSRMVNFRLAEVSLDQIQETVEALGLASRTDVVKLAVAMLHERATDDPDSIPVMATLRDIRNAEREERQRGDQPSSVRGAGSAKTPSKRVRIRGRKPARGAPSKG